MPDYFGIQSFGREVQDAEIGRVRRTDVATADVLSRRAYGTRQRFGRALHSVGVSALGRVLKTSVVLVREFRINRQPCGSAITLFR